MSQEKIFIEKVKKLYSEVTNIQNLTIVNKIKNFYFNLQSKVNECLFILTDEIQKEFEYYKTAIDLHLAFTQSITNNN